MNEIMKKTLLYSAIALATLSTSSCGDSFLSLDPVGSVSEGTLTNAEGIDYVLTAAYSSFNNMNQTGWMGYASLSNYVFGDVVGGDANKGSQSTDQSDFTALEVYNFNNSNSYIAGKWAAVYEAVKRANNVLDMVEKMGDGLPNASVIAGQALFIKSVWMFEGIKMFGAAIPYVSLEAYRGSTDPQVSNVDESGNYVYIWKDVEADLKDAISSLPATWGDNNYGRATSWMAKALLAKLYLYWSSPYNGTNDTQNHWKEAKDLFQDIIEHGVDAKGKKYDLAAKYGDLFDVETSDWNGEGIFDVQTTIQGTQTDTNAISYTPAIGQPGASGIGGWGFYQPTFEFVNSFIVDANGLPEANYTKMAPLTPNGPTPETDLTVAVDPRLDFSVGRFGVPFLDYGTPTTLNGWVRDYTNGGMYMNKKNLPKISDRGSTSVSTAVVSSAKNFHVIRLADVMLMYAECCIHDNDLGGALEYINKVRARAAKDFIAADETTKGTYTLDDKVNGKTVDGTAGNYRVGLYTSFANADEAWTALKRERRAELGMEGHHWFDLARWGDVDWLNTVFRAYEEPILSKYSNVYGKNWVTFPIPFANIQTAEGRFVQNVNWK